MKRKYNLRKLNMHKSYDSIQLQEILGVHRQTIKTWKKEGLKPIEGGNSPYLYSGRELIDFLTNRTLSQKVKLNDNEMYCMKCNKAVIPEGIETLRRGIILGSGNESIVVKGICPLCKGKMSRFSSIKNTLKIVDVNKEVEQLKMFG